MQFSWWSIFKLNKRKKPVTWYFSCVTFIFKYILPSLLVHCVYFHNLVFYLNYINDDEFLIVCTLHENCLRNTGKYGPEKTPYLDTFHTVVVQVSKARDNNNLQFPGHICQFFFLSVANSWKFLWSKSLMRGLNVLNIIRGAKLFLYLTSSVVKSWIFRWWFVMSIFLPSISANELILSSKITLS